MATLVQFPSQPPEGQNPGFLLREILDGNGNRIITRWLSLYPGGAARLRVRVRNLRRAPRTEWSKKQFRYLGKGIFEIKWEFEKKQFRILGFDSSPYFVCLIGCIHKDDVY